MGNIGCDKHKHRNPHEKSDTEKCHRPHWNGINRSGDFAAGEHGAQINAINLGIIVTPLAKDELTGRRGAGYRRMSEMTSQNC